MKLAKKKKPFSVVSVSRDIIYDYQTHLSSYLKKTVTHRGEKMRIREGMLFEYTQTHPTEVWIKYSLSADAQWHRFPLEKKSLSDYLSNRICLQQLSIHKQCKS